jgi:hypothetical protein
MCYLGRKKTSHPSRSLAQQLPARGAGLVVQTVVIQMAHLNSFKGV